MAFLLNLPAVAQLYLSVVSLSMLLISDEVSLRLIGLAGTIITAIVTLFKFVKDSDMARKVKRLGSTEQEQRTKIELLEKEVLALRADLHQSQQDRNDLRQRNEAFEQERASFRAGIEKRVAEMEERLQK